MPGILPNGRVRLASFCAVSTLLLISSSASAQSETTRQRFDVSVESGAGSIARDVLSRARNASISRRVERTPEELAAFENRRSSARKLAEERIRRNAGDRRRRTDEPERAATGSSTASTVITFTVNSAYDNSDTNPGDGVCDVGFDVGGTDECTLRAAIEEANATAGTEQVTIAIDLLSPTRGGYSQGYDATHDVWSIIPTAALPAVTRNNTLVDGTKQLDGSNIGTFPDAYCGSGLNNPSDTTIVKVNIDGSVAGPSTDGLTASGEEIGFWGVSVTNFGGHGIVGDGALYLGVFCAYVGVDVFGKTAGPNGGYGVVFDGGHTNVVTTSLVSGNDAGGVLIVGDNSSVYNSYVGTDRKGMYAIANDLAGVYLEGTGNSVLGSMVSGNDVGIVMAGDSGAVQSSLVGLDHTYGAALPNATYGVYVGGMGNLVGGQDWPNVSTVSGNTGTGIFLADTSRANTVDHVYVGTSVSGTIAVPNGDGGIKDDGTDNLIGGMSPFSSGRIDADRSNGSPDTRFAKGSAILIDYRVLVSGNIGGGIILDGDSTMVAGARVGTDPTGTSQIPNSLFGIWVLSGSGHSLGDQALGNLVSGNGGPGIKVNHMANGTTIRSSKIGTDHAGNTAIPNQGVGILNAGTATLITDNFISGNIGHGIDNPGTATIIQNNSIGTNYNGDVAIPNQGDGIYSTGAEATMGGVGGDGNLISGNTGYGVHIGPLTAPLSAERVLSKSSGAVSITLLNNFIGTDGAGQMPVPNGLDGILNDGGQYVVIGQVSEGNRIAFNGKNGIASRGSSVSTIRANRIFANTLLGIDIGPDGVTPNDVGPPHDTDGHQNYPEITSAASASSGSATINFDFHSTPSTSFVFDYFISESADGSGHGEGKYYLGNLFASTDGNGDYSIGQFFTHPELLSGNWITMTATSAGTGETSEFSEAVKIKGNSVLLTGRVFLQGPYSGSAMSTALTSGGYVPTLQPYQSSFFDGTELEYDELVTAEDPQGVDWIVVSLRLLPPAVSEIARTVGFVSSDGYFLGLSGETGIEFPGVTPAYYHVVVCHRNHLCAMSFSLVDFTGGTGTWDFTTDLSKAYTTGSPPMKQLGSGVYGLFAGDANADGLVTAPDFNAWNAATTAGATGYLPSDFNMDVDVTAPDFNLWNANTTAGAASQVPN